MTCTLLTYPLLSCAALQPLLQSLNLDSVDQLIADPSWAPTAAYSITLQYLPTTSMHDGLVIPTLNQNSTNLVVSGSDCSSFVIVGAKNNASIIRPDIMSLQGCLIQMVDAVLYPGVSQSTSSSAPLQPPPPSFPPVASDHTVIDLVSMDPSLSFVSTALIRCVHQVHLIVLLP